MSELLKPTDVANCVSALISKNKLWAGKNVYLFLISNETAGCFKDRKKSEKYKKLFNNAEKEAQNKTSCVKSISTKIFSTEYAGHAKDLALAITAELIASKQKDDEYVLAIAGGDGTSLEVQTTLYNAAQEVPQKREVIMNQITILRLPLGTGNDGTDGHSVEELIDLLKGPLQFTNSCAIQVYPEGNPTPEQIAASGKIPEHYCDTEYKAPWLAFNMAGMGIDAYICHMTNVIKKKFPGNFYHAVIDLCGLVYDKKFTPGTGIFEYFDENGTKIKEITSKIEMFDMGVSGYRVEGGGHKILPDENNTCLTHKLNIFQLMTNNKHYVDGTHAGTWLATMLKADKVRITYDQPVLIQCDGEVVLLCKEHFPIIMEKTKPCLRVLKKSN